MRAIETCRTAYLGGHAEKCNCCGFKRPAYNSCRNRHCPKCQALVKARWLQDRKSELLPVGYFHTVFTIPHELNLIAMYNSRIIYDLLFRSVAETLQEFAADPKHLGGKPGFTAILHTWDQKLLYHIHLHCVIPGGALSHDGKRWIHARKEFLFPVKALSKMFRGKFTAYLKEEFINGDLKIPEGVYFNRLLNQLWKKEWVVYAKAPFGGPEKVLDYLGRYTHRVAISNNRIKKVKNGMVSFTYRDRADGDSRKMLTLPAPELIRRFLKHVLPKSYMRIRHFGFLAPRSKGRDLARCRELLGVVTEDVKLPRKTPRQLMLEITGVDIEKCPRCKLGRMCYERELASVSYLDSS
jgi:hypothetical protein